MWGRGAGGLLLLLLFFRPIAHAQTITDTLQNVDVKGVHTIHSTDARIRAYTPGQQLQFFDSLTLQQYNQQSLVALLAQQSSVFVKSYGVNNLATLTFRGASAAQSAVLWNGIPLQNAALGIADVSTLPVAAVDKIGILYGSSTALLGSGNVGGALLLEDNQPRFDSFTHSHLQATVSSGSYRQYGAALKGSWQSRSWYASLKLSGQSAKNDFGYTDAFGRGATLANAQLRSGSASLTVAHRLGSCQTISLTTWLQAYSRAIPPALFEAVSAKHQDDGAQRFLLQWQYQRGATSAYMKAAWFRNPLTYQDSTVRLYSNLVTNQAYAEAGWNHQWRNQSLLLFAPVQYSFIPPVADSPRYSQWRLALAGAYRVSLLAQRLQLSASARAEGTNGRQYLLPGANASFQLLPQLQLRGNVQRTYRLPALSELYYNPGGNRSLLPETGWNEDGGYSLSLNKGHWQLTHEGTFFDRNIHNWIIWYGGAIWTPHNIAAVHSRGLETNNKLSWRGGFWRVTLSANVAYTLSTTTQSVAPADNSLGKQIPYTPKWSGQGSFTLQHKRLLLQYAQAFTGLRYVTIDESQSVDGYQTASGYASWQTAIHKLPVSLFAQISNLWNRRYQVVAYRPMPGINFLAGFTLTLQ